MRKRRSEAERLRNAVEALPHHTKQGMLRGISGNRIIVGAYTDKRGGVCPMLAAHRNGGRTDFASFARAWDAFTGAKRPRRASARELRALRGYLEVALIRDGVAPDDAGGAASAWADRPLREAVREVQASRRASAAAAAERDGVTIEELLERARREAAALPERAPAARPGSDAREHAARPGSGAGEAGTLSVGSAGEADPAAANVSAHGADVPSAV